MAQHDLDIANGSGSAVRADINGALAALGSTMKGPNAPPSPLAGMMWVEDDTPSSSVWTLKMYDGADWITIGTLDSSNNRFVFNGLFSGTTAGAPGIAPSGDSNTGLFSPSGDVLAVSTAGVERMRFTSTMRVVIGATSASSLFHVSNATDTSQAAQLRVENTNGAAGYADLILQDVRGSTDQEKISLRNSAGIFQVGPLNDAESGFTSRFGISTNGIVFLNKSTPDATAVGAEVDSGGTFSFTASGVEAGRFYRRGSDGAAIGFFRDVTAVGSISVTGSATAYNTSSDERLKEIRPYPSDLSALWEALRPERIVWRAHPDAGEQWAFLAQRVHAAVPHAVTVGSEAAPGEEGFRAWQLSEGSLTPAIAALLHELRAEVAALKSRVAALEAA
jgi:hypothetical protein